MSDSNLWKFQICFSGGMDIKLVKNQIKMLYLLAGLSHDVVDARVDEAVRKDFE